MTPAEFESLVERLEGLLERATPGPWVLFNENRTLQVNSARQKLGGNPSIVAWTGFDGSGLPFKKCAANAALIAESPEAIRALLTALRETRQALDSLVIAVENMEDLDEMDGEEFHVNSEFLNNAELQARSALSKYPLAEPTNEREG